MWRPYSSYDEKWCCMGRIKVLQVAQATGGVQKHVLYLANGLDKERFEVVGACPPIDRIKGVDKAKTSFPQALKGAGIRVFAIDMYRRINPIGDLISFLKILKLIKKEKFDIVHTHSSKAGFLGRLSAKLLGVPVILYTPNAFAFDKPKAVFLLKIFYLYLEKLAARWCDIIITASDSERNLALRHKIASPDKIITINNVIDREKIKVVPPPDIARKHRELGIDANDKVVITVARLTQQKSPLDFVKMAERIIEKRKNVKFFIVGDGPLLGKTTNFIHKKKLEKYIKLLGWRTDVEELLYISDVFVLTSLWEGLPYTVMEAMALKKPVVATDVVGTRDLIKDSYSGYLVPPHREDLLAKKVSELLESPEISGKMGLKGYEMLEKRMSLTEHIRTIEDLYTKSLKDKLKE